MENCGRLFNCNHCRCQVVICSDCDRGNIYCSDCSGVARAEAVRSAGKRYQNTPRGKHKHAARQQQYRLRVAKKVTHQGSPDLSLHDLLLDVSKGQPQIKLESVTKEFCCHFCGNQCSPHLRLGFQRRDAELSFVT